MIQRYSHRPPYPHVDSYEELCHVNINGILYQRDNDTDQAADFETAACLLLGWCLFGCGGTFPRLGALMTFEMEDQFRNSHSDADFDGRALVVIGGDREGASAAENWGKAAIHPQAAGKGLGRLSLVGLSTSRASRSSSRVTSGASLPKPR